MLDTGHYSLLWDGIPVLALQALLLAVLARLGLVTFRLQRAAAITRLKMELSSVSLISSPYLHGKTYLGSTLSLLVVGA